MLRQEFHYFAGFSGVLKHLCQGIFLSAIQANHKFMVNGAACTGKIEILTEDIEAAK